MNTGTKTNRKKKTGEKIQCRDQKNMLKTRRDYSLRKIKDNLYTQNKNKRLLKIIKALRSFIMELRLMENNNIEGINSRDNLKGKFEDF